MDSMILGCEVSSVVSNNTVQSAVMLDKTFFKSTDGGFKHYVQESQIYTMNKYVLNKDKALSTEKVVQCNQTATGTLAGNPRELCYI